MYIISNYNSYTVSGKLHTRTITHHIGIGPGEWFYWLVVKLSWWGVVQVGSGPRVCSNGGRLLGCIGI